MIRFDVFLVMLLLLVVWPLQALFPEVKWHITCAHLGIVVGCLLAHFRINFRLGAPMFGRDDDGGR